MKHFFHCAFFKIDTSRLCRLGAFALVIDMYNTPDCMPQDLAASSAGAPSITDHVRDSVQDMPFDWGQISLEQASNERGEICTGLFFWLVSIKI